MFLPKSLNGRKLYIVVLFEKQFLFNDRYHHPVFYIYKDYIMRDPDTKNASSTK